MKRKVSVNVYAASAEKIDLDRWWAKIHVRMWSEDVLMDLILGWFFETQASICSDQNLY